MTPIRVSLKTAIKMALLPYPDLPKWKIWRLRHPERDKKQRKAYRERNRQKISANARERYRRKKKAKSDSTNERRRSMSGGAG
jgi:transposase